MQTSNVLHEISTETMYADFGFTTHRLEHISGPYHLKRFTVDYRMYKRVDHNAQQFQTLSFGPIGNPHVQSFISLLTLVTPTLLYEVETWEPSFSNANKKKDDL